MWGCLSCEVPGFACYGIRLRHIEVEEAVAGKNRSDRGHSSDDHPDGCGAAVLDDDVVVRIKKEQILV